MPRPSSTLPAPQTDAARAQAANFFCDLCQKGYARQHEYAAHESSYEHNHNKHRKELQAMKTSMGNARNKSKKRDDDGIRDLTESEKKSMAPVRTFKKFGTTSSFKTLGGEPVKVSNDGQKSAEPEKRMNKVEESDDEVEYEMYDPVKGASCGPECVACGAG